MRRHLKLSGRGVIESGMNRLSIVLDFQPVGDLVEGILKISEVSLIDVFNFEGAQEALGNTVLSRFAGLGHTDANARFREHIRMEPG